MRTLLLAALVLPLAACDSTRTDPLDFGDAYRVEAAVLDGDTLRAVVQYSGGCASHAFELRTQSTGGAWEVWFVHDAANDGCEALVTDTLAAEMAFLPRTAAPVVLRTPVGGEISLR